MLEEINQSVAVAGITTTQEKKVSKMWNFKDTFT